MGPATRGDEIAADGAEGAPSSGVAPVAARDDCVRIRGRTINLGELVDRRIFDPAYRQMQSERMAGERPFPHLLLDGFFHPSLLDLVHEEFELVSDGFWQTIRSTHEKTYRSRPSAQLGPATQLYFGIVHSAPFLDFLSAVSGVEDLLPDPRLYGAGMHETRDGGTFDIHRDFDRHTRYGLNNELVFITYLNKDWKPSWGGAFELWDRNEAAPRTMIPAHFGCSVLFRQGPNSFHGHRAPWSQPAGKPRRSVATFFYTNPAQVLAPSRKPTTYLFPNATDTALRLARAALPPAVWDVLVSIARI